jgi:hypothetical protein
MHLLRRFPQVGAPLGDGRLCLSTLGLLGPLLTEKNVDEVIARAAWLTKRQTEELVVSIQPRTAPRDGIRKLPVSVARATPGPDPEQESGIQSSPLPAPRGLGVRGGTGSDPADPVPPPLALTLEPAPRPQSRPTLEPISAGQWSLRVTLDGPLKADMQTLQNLLSHKIPTGSLTEVVREAVRCAIEKHGKRRGAVRPGRTRKGKGPAPRPAGERQPVSAEVTRQVWERDGGQCTYLSQDGRRCQSRWQLELDHVESPRQGGPATADELRLRCRPHNIFHAEQTFGRAHMAKFRRARRAWPVPGSTTPGGSAAGRERPPDIG